jgi:hypothetical protein
MYKEVCGKKLRRRRRRKGRHGKIKSDRKAWFQAFIQSGKVCGGGSRKYHLVQFG